MGGEEGESKEYKKRAMETDCKRHGVGLGAASELNSMGQHDYFRSG